VVSYESLHGKDFKTEVQVEKYMRVQAKTIIKNNQLISTSSEHEFLYKHFKTNLGFAKINVNSKTCTSYKFLDKGVFKHLVAACLKQKINLPGLVQLPKKFMTIRRKRLRNYVDESRENSIREDEDIINTNEEDQVLQEQRQQPAQKKRENQRLQTLKLILKRRSRL
jgi:hypothetical protein